MLIRGHNLVWANGSQTPAWVFREADGVTPLSATNPGGRRLADAAHTEPHHERSAALRQRNLRVGRGQ